MDKRAASAARYLKKISRSLSLKLYAHCVRRSGFAAFVEARRQLRILSISDSFRAVTRLLRWYLLDLYKSFAGLGLLILLMLALQNEFWMRGLQVVGFATLSLPFIFPLVAVLRSTLDKRWPKLIRKMRNRTLFVGFVNSELLEDYAALPKLFAIQLLLFSLCSNLLNVIGVPRLHSSGMQFSDIAWPVNVSIIVLSALIAFPLRPNFWRILKRNLLRLSRSTVLRALGMLLSLALVLLFTSLIPPHILTVIAVVIGTITVCVTCLLFGALGVEYWKDWRELRTIRRGFAPDRYAIARNFVAMQTRWGRMQYVEWLEDVSMDHIEALRRDANIWPDGRRPQSDGDEGSIRLAQLDARWLDLD